MLRLHTLGAPHLTRDGTRLEALSAQRRALALLAMLAAAGPRGLSRDVIAARLWPESDEERARLSLRQLLHVLRPQLGAPEPIVGSADLRLDPAAMTTDVGDFRAALERGDAAAVVALHAGPFLDGFHLRGADEFERWTSAEREVLARDAARALEQLAAVAAAHGDHRAAVEAWRRLAAMEPLSARAAVGLMRALDAGGERAEALRHARVHEALVRAEVGDDPDPSVASLAAELRRAATVAEPAARDRPPAPARDAAAAPLAGPPGDRAAPGAARPVGQPRARRAARIAGAVGAVALGALGIHAASRDAPTAERPAPAESSAREAPRAPPPRAAPARPAVPAAREAYLRGRYVFNSRTGADGILQAQRFFEEAIARDPLYAPAHAGLSDTYARLAVFGYAPPREAFARAKESALRAVALDGTLAEAYSALGHALVAADFDWVASERAFRQAIALDPTYVFARGPYAIALLGQGRFDEAAAQLDTARAADALAIPASTVLGRVYVAAGRPDDAIRVLREVVRINPLLDLAHQQLGHAYLQKGMPAEAIDALRRAAAISGPRDSAQLAYAYAVTGRRAEAERVLGALRGAEARNTGALAYHLAMAYAGLGDQDAAFARLERAHADRATLLLKVDPAFATLRGDPRWASLVRRMGLE